MNHSKLTSFMMNVFIVYNNVYLYVILNTENINNIIIPKNKKNNECICGFSLKLMCDSLSLQFY